jgi:hypothetical protein
VSRSDADLLFHSSGLPLEMIEHFTDSLWGHAALILRVQDIDSMLLLESVHTYGVRAGAMSNRINGGGATPAPYPGKLLVLRHRQFPPETEQAAIGKTARVAIGKLGYPYSQEEIARIGLRIAAGMAGRTLAGQLEPVHAFVCSEYVAKCYDAMGITLAPDREGFIAPADLANDPNVYAVCAIRADRAAA